jgi:hypothetical protein
MRIWIVAVGFILVVLAGLLTFQQQLVSALVLPPYIEWVKVTEQTGVQTGEPLDTKQLLLAQEIGIKHPEKVRLVYVESVPFPYDNLMLTTVGEALGFIGEGIVNNAQVFGYAIYVRRGYPLTTPQLAHELVHVLQIERSDLQQVITQHFADLVTYGYENSPLEVEAFAANEKYRGR